MRLLNRIIFPTLCLPLSFLTLAAETQTLHYPAAATDLTLPTSPEVSLPLIRPDFSPYLANLPPSAPLPPFTTHCIITPLGWNQDDTPQILSAARKCGTNGIITLPAPYVYTIATRLHLNLDNSRLEVFGTLAFTPDIQYWSTQSFGIEFQNHGAAFLLTGSNFEVTGGGFAQGGIDGSGQAWMTLAQGKSGVRGRPMSLTIYNATNVVLKDFSIRQPQLWAIYMQDISNATISGLYINGTNTDTKPGEIPQASKRNFVTNIDGIDTLRVDNLLIEDMVFWGGDDCVTFKGNSTNMILRNISCVGGGIAFGSLGQYPQTPDYVSNISISNVTVAQEINPVTGGAPVSGGVWFKSWPGIPLERGGGGWGKVSNVTVKGLKVKGTRYAVGVKKGYHKGDMPDSALDSALVGWEGLKFEDVTGWISGEEGISMNCSSSAPCRDVEFRSFNLKRKNGAEVRNVCVNTVDVRGIICDETASQP